MKTIIFLILIITTLTLIPSSYSQCTSNDDCPKGWYCKKPTGQCDANGVCTEKPLLCPDNWAPVCGCDGQTYANECYAAEVGVNIAYFGQCNLSNQCTDNNDCQAGYYCKKPTGQCDANGLCTEKPIACPDVWNPVCGCDGQTYANECYAAKAGINIEYLGQCIPPGPTTIMMEPKVIADDVHTGKSGVNYLMILWSEPVIFDANNITIYDMHNSLVSFNVIGNMTELMKITFNQTLLHDSYKITISDSVVSVATGNPIDGDDDGHAGGNAVITMQHNRRTDYDNNNIIDFYDFAQLAQDWLLTF